MRARRFRTQQDIERYVAQGFGQGVGVDYKPWLRVQDVPSRGRSRKVHGLKTGRVHHVLSDLEPRYLVTLEFSERVVDIREQFPLLPVAPIQDVARQRSIRYPLYAGTTVPFVMTTDFVVTVKEGDGSVREFARTVKYADELTTGSRRQASYAATRLKLSAPHGAMIGWDAIIGHRSPGSGRPGSDSIRQSRILRGHRALRPQRAA
jgi:hypothetical protein